MSVTFLQNQTEPDLTKGIKTSYKIDLDDRCYLFPDGKLVTHLMVSCAQDKSVILDGVYAFNNTHRSPRIAAFSLAEAQGFVREFVNAVYYAKTSFFITDTLKFTCTVAANGYHLEIVRAEETVELLLSVGAIWRILRGLLMALDSAAPVSAN